MRTQGSKNRKIPAGPSCCQTRYYDGRPGPVHPSCRCHRHDVVIVIDRHACSVPVDQVQQPRTLAVALNVLRRPSPAVGLIFLARRTRDERTKNKTIGIQLLLLSLPYPFERKERTNAFLYSTPYNTSAPTCVSQNEALITCLPGRHCHPLVDICLCPTNSR